MMTWSKGVAASLGNGSLHCLFACCGRQRLADTSKCYGFGCFAGAAFGERDARLTAFIYLFITLCCAGAASGERDPHVGVYSCIQLFRSCAGAASGERDPHVGGACGHAPARVCQRQGRGCGHPVSEVAGHCLHACGRGLDACWSIAQLLLAYWCCKTSQQAHVRGQ